MKKRYGLTPSIISECARRYEYGYSYMRMAAEYGVAPSEMRAALVTHGVVIREGEPILPGVTMAPATPEERRAIRAAQRYKLSKRLMA